jgi:transmembrane sensor
MSDADHRDSDRRETRKRDLISQEAAEWFARMKDPHVPLDERQHFLRWLKQSQVHVAEYLRVADIDGDLRRAALTFAMTDEAPSNVVPLFAGESERSTERGVGSLPWKIAAAIVVCALATLLFLSVGAAWYERSIETDFGEWKTVDLADGSELQLGPNTSLTVDLGDEQRSIVLARGEAYFKVAKETRPFRVQAKAFAVQAVGTEFAVSRRKGELIVTVREGKVRVTPSTKLTKSGVSDAEPSELSVPITADYQLRIPDDNTWPLTPNRIDVRYELAWREKQLMFKAGDTLADAVDEFNLRNRVQLQLDQRAASLPVRGSFDASDPVAFAQTVDKTSPVVVRRLAADTLQINAE